MNQTATVILHYYCIYTVEHYGEKQTKKYLQNHACEFVKENMKLPKNKRSWYETDWEREDCGDGENFRNSLKFCGELTGEQFKLFMKSFNPLETCDTMGSLTVEHGWLAAISLSTGDDGYGSCENCYASVIPITDPDELFKGHTVVHAQKVITEQLHPALARAEALIKSSVEEEGYKTGYNNPDFEFISEIELNLSQLYISYKEPKNENDASKTSDKSTSV